MPGPDPYVQWAPTDVGVLEVVHQKDHESAALSRLPGVLRNQLHVRRLMMAMCKGVQAAEDLVWGVYIGTRLGLAEGASLDRWGALVGEPRGSLLYDSDYRAIIEARILANRCDGTVDSMMQVMRTALAPVDCIEHFDLFPAGFQMQAAREEWMSEERRGRVRAILDDIAPAGRVAVWVEAVFGGFGPPESQCGNVFTGPLSRII